MADSDNSTSLPFVIHRRSRQNSVCGGQLREPQDAVSGGIVDAPADPAIRLAEAWRMAHLNTLCLCERQQALERELGGWDGASPAPSLNGTCLSGSRERTDGDGGYAAARLAEERAAEEAGALLEALFQTPAGSMAGVIAKLEILLLESEVGDAPGDFPWPHIRSTLADLKKHAGSDAPLLGGRG